MPRVLVALVTLAFCVASTVYAAHLHEAGKKNAVAHCEICLHLGGTTSAPPPPSVVAFAPVVTIEAAIRDVDAFIVIHRPRAHRSRAPPPLHP
jgi:hypothetical protein